MHPLYFRTGGEFLILIPWTLFVILPLCLGLGPGIEAARDPNARMIPDFNPWMFLWRFGLRRLKVWLVIGSTGLGLWLAAILFQSFSLIRHAWTGTPLHNIIAPMTLGESVQWSLSEIGMVAMWVCLSIYAALLWAPRFAAHPIPHALAASALGFAMFGGILTFFWFVIPEPWRSISYEWLPPNTLVQLHPTHAMYGGLVSISLLAWHVRRIRNDPRKWMRIET